MKIYNALSYSISSDIRDYGQDIDNPLISYWAVLSTKKNIQTIKEYKRFHNKYFLDSGAFSAFTKNVSIDISDYIKFIKDNKNIFKNYAVLDVIGDAKETLKNQIIMEKQGLAPIPCFHYGEPFSYLEEYCKKYDYIALGGLVPLSLKRSVLKRHLSKCFEIISKRKNKIHLFGITSKWVLESFPAYSADSTSAFGSIWGTVSKLSKGKKMDYKTNIEAFGMIDRDGKKNYRRRVIFMIKETKKLEKYITEIWKKRGVTWKN